MAGTQANHTDLCQSTSFLISRYCCGREHRPCSATGIYPVVRTVHGPGTALQGNDALWKFFGTASSRIADIQRELSGPLSPPPPSQQSLPGGSAQAPGPVPSSPAKSFLDAAPRLPEPPHTSASCAASVNTTPSMNEFCWEAAVAC